MAALIEMAAAAMPAVLAVLVEVRVPAARTAAPYTYLPRHLPSTAMCLCVQLQDSPPSKDDPKYMNQARNALLAKMMSGQKITMRMLRKEAKKFHRREYQTWNKQHNRAKKRHARDEKDATLLAELGLSSESSSSPPLALSSPPPALLSPLAALLSPLARSPTSVVDH
jgi:hypothetical protein